MRILLDMDEVLVNWINGVCLHLGKSEQQCDELFGVKDRLGNLIWDDKLLLFLRNKSYFWRGLNPLPYADQMLRLAQSHTKDVWIVTRPMDCPSSYVGKIEWLQSWMVMLHGAHPLLEKDNSFKRFLITPYKHLLANSDTVLIDDSMCNCLDFIDAGGKAILFPHRRNHLRNHADSPVQHVSYWLDNFERLNDADILLEPGLTATSSTRNSADQTDV